MNLLIVASYWPNIKNTISGIFVVQQSAALARAGNKVTIIALTTRGKNEPRLCSLRELGLTHLDITLEQIPTLRLPEKLCSLSGFLRINTTLCGNALNTYFRNRHKSFTIDGCIVHGTKYAGLSMPIWREKVDGRAVIVLHGADPATQSQSRKKNSRAVFAGAGAASDSIVLVGKPLIAYALSLGFNERSLRVIPNGTDLPPLYLVNGNQRACKQKRRVVSVSNLVPLKGISDNLHALAVINNNRPDLQWEYIIVGDGPCYEELKNLSISLKIDKSVNFLGRISYEKTMYEIEKSDIFSLPSWGEAFGIVYLEAMARMRPVIGCYENGAADILTNEKEGFLINPRNISELVKALTKLLENPEMCMQMGKHGREKAEELSWDENAKKMLQALTK